MGQNWAGALAPFLGRGGGSLSNTMSLGMVADLSPGHIVLDGDPAPPPKKKGGTVPQSSVHVCHGQTARRIKMPLAMEVGLGPGDIVLDRDPALPKKGEHSTPNFRPMSTVAKQR